MSAVREGPVVRVQLDCGFPLVAVLGPPQGPGWNLREGDEVTATVRAEAVRLVPPE